MSKVLPCCYCEIGPKLSDILIGVSVIKMKGQIDFAGRIVPELVERRFARRGPLLSIDTGSGVASLADFNVDRVRDEPSG
jgi:hypothetical protein